MELSALKRSFEGVTAPKVWNELRTAAKRSSAADAKEVFFFVVLDVRGRDGNASCSSWETLFKSLEGSAKKN